MLQFMHSFSLQNLRYVVCIYKYLYVYVFHSKACGSFIESDSVGAAISSPLYPAKYPNNQNCSWIIQAQEPCK